MQLLNNETKEDMKIIQQGNDTMAGGEYIQIELSNGRIVTVWDKSVDDDKVGVIEIHESQEAADCGDPTTSSILVP